MAENKSEYFDNKTGYTDDMFLMHQSIVCYVRFVRTLVSLELIQIRNAQLLTSNYSQKIFNDLRDEKF